MPALAPAANVPPALTWTLPVAPLPPSVPPAYRGRRDDRPVDPEQATVHRGCAGIGVHAGEDQLSRAGLGQAAVPGDASRRGVGSVADGCGVAGIDLQGDRGRAVQEHDIAMRLAVGRPAGASGRAGGHAVGSGEGRVLDDQRAAVADEDRPAERLAHARLAIETGQAPIKQIAHRVGYTHVSNFTAAFTRRYGAPPSQYQGRGNGGDDA
jgi:hypothetical protein